MTSKYEKIDKNAAKSSLQVRSRLEEAVEQKLKVYREDPVS